MGLKEILDDLKKDDFNEIWKAAKRLSELDRSDFEDFGFEAAIDKILEILEFYTEVDTKNPELWEAIISNNKEKKWEEIKETIREKLRELDVTPYNLNDKGIDAQDEDNDDLALKYYKQAVILDPNYRWSWYNLGNIYRIKDNNTKAVECYKKAVEIYPDYGDAWNNLGNAYYDLNEINKARESYEKAASIESYNSKHLPIYNIGLLYDKLGEKKKAIEYFKKAIELKNDYAKAQYNLGRVFYEIGDFLEAQKYFTLALINDFDNYYKEIEDYNLNVYDLVSKHLINSYMKFFKLDRNSIERNRAKYVKYVEKIIKNKFHFDKYIDSILDDEDYRKSWSKEYKKGNAESLDVFISSWIFEYTIEYVDTNTDNTTSEHISDTNRTKSKMKEYDFNLFKIKLLIKSINYFPGSEISESVKNKLIATIYETYDFLRKFKRDFIIEIDSNNYKNMKPKIKNVFAYLQEKDIKIVHKEDFFNLIKDLAEFLKNRIQEKYNKEIFKIFKYIITKFVKYLDDNDASLEVTFFLLDLIKFFFDKLEPDLSLECAHKAKHFFNLLNYEEDAKKVSNIIDKIKKSTIRVS